MKREQRATRNQYALPLSDRYFFGPSRVRFCLGLAVCSRGTVCPVPRETDGKVREAIAEKMKFMRTNASECGIIPADNSRIVAFDASVGTSETWKVHVCAKRSGECTRRGAYLSRGFTQGFSRASDGTREKSAPSFFSRVQKEGMGRLSRT